MSEVVPVTDRAVPQWSSSRAGSTLAASLEHTNTAASVELPALLDRLEIVEGTGPHTVTIREFDRWAAPLDEMVPQVLSEDLALAESSQHDAHERPSGERHLAIHIDQFMECADGIVRLDGTWTVLARSGQHTWRFALQAPADPGQVATIAASMSRLLERLAATIAGTS